jgi:hypothetical protein
MSVLGASSRFDRDGDEWHEFCLDSDDSAAERSRCGLRVVWKRGFRLKLLQSGRAHFKKASGTRW